MSLPPELVVDVPVRESRPAEAVGTNGHGDRVEVQEPPAVVASAEPHSNGEAAFAAEALPQRVQAIPEPRPVEPAPVEAMGERTLGAAPSTRTPDERRHQLSSFLRRLDEGRASETPEPGVAEEQAS